MDNFDDSDLFWDWFNLYSKHKQFVRVDVAQDAFKAGMGAATDDELLDLLAKIRSYYSASNDYRPPYVKDAFDIIEKLGV